MRISSSPGDVITIVLPSRLQRLSACSALDDVAVPSAAKPIVLVQLLWPQVPINASRVTGDSATEEGAVEPAPAELAPLAVSADSPPQPARSKTAACAASTVLLCIGFPLAAQNAARCRS